MTKFDPPRSTAAVQGTGGTGGAHVPETFRAGGPAVVEPRREPARNSAAVRSGEPVRSSEPTRGSGPLPATEPVRNPAGSGSDSRSDSGGPADRLPGDLPSAPAAASEAAPPRGGAIAPHPEPEAPLRVTDAPLPPGEVSRLVGGWHHNPHGVLGAHPTPQGTAVRVLRPFAERVVLETATERYELTHQQDGLFTVLVPGPEGDDDAPATGTPAVLPDYRLRVAYDGAELLQDDGYRLLPTLGETDLHLIGEGRHEQLWQALGSHVRTVQGITGTAFAVWAPNAAGVRIIGDFNGWSGSAHPMRSLGATGVWELFVPGIGEGSVYKFEIATRDGRMLQKADPMARATEVPPATASVVTRSTHTWHDQEWLDRRAEIGAHAAPISVYEVHLASWRPGLSYRELAVELPAYVRDLGFTHVELMPIMEHPFGGSWGYQVTGFYAPTSRLGTPDDFRFLVDALHQAGVGVIVDWVPAHFPKDDFALARFDGQPLYEPSDPLRAEHPDWGTLEFDYGRTEVRNFLVANAVYWCEEFHVDGLRVDAVASMLYLDYSREGDAWSPNASGGRENWDAVRFLQEMNATVYRRCPGVTTVAEESTAWPGVTRATEHSGLGFGLKWNMGWMHDSLEYMAHEPVHRRYHHNEMTFSMVYAYSENYLLPISHDEVVHGKKSLVSKMPGDWWQQRANVRAYLAFMWAHPGKKLLFMGQEFAQGAEWNHDEGPQWWLLGEDWPAAADHRGVQDLVRDLNRIYVDSPALWQLDTDPAGFAWIDGGAAEDNVFSFVRTDRSGRPLVSVTNLSPVVRRGYRVGLPDLPAELRDARWLEVLNTDTAVYGGGGVGNPDPVKAEPTPWNGRDTSAELTLPPLATVWLSPA